MSCFNPSQTLFERRKKNIIILLMTKCYLEWSPLYLYLMNPSQYRVGRSFCIVYLCTEAFVCFSQDGHDTWCTIDGELSDSMTSPDWIWPLYRTRFLHLLYTVVFKNHRMHPNYRTSWTIGDKKSHNTCSHILCISYTPTRTPTYMKECTGDECGAGQVLLR